jgi:hypothetical protein
MDDCPRWLHVTIMLPQIPNVTSYFAICHSKNQQFMLQNSQTILEDYIKLAPASAVINATSGEYQRFHRKDTNSLDNDRYSTDTIATIPNYFQAIIPSTDPLWIDRPVVFAGRVGNYSNPKNMSRIYQMQYKLADLANDVRVSYQSTKYPWLEAVYRFKMSALQAVRPDVAVKINYGFFVDLFLAFLDSRFRRLRKIYCAILVVWLP